jgi:hypothetical protein
MLIRAMLGKRLLPVVAIALVLPTAVSAQGSGPSPSSFGGGATGLSGGVSGLSGGLSGLSGGATGLSGGTSGLSGGMTGLSGGNQSTGSFRGGFWGSMPNGATGYQGGFGGGGFGGNSGQSAAFGATNAFGKYYFNPLAPGAPNASSTNNFNQPIYGGATGLQGGNFQNYNSPGQGNQGNLNPAGAGARRPAYVVGLGFGYRPAGLSVTQTEVEQILARSTGLNPNRAIRVAVDGPAIILRGTVASEYDRRLAEALIRLSPGVYEVRNELEVPETKPP